MAISGDTVVVGASVEDSDGIGVDGDGSNNMANGAGAAYIFVRSNTTWTEQAFLKASNTDAFDGFGFSVAVAGDTVVVGANNEGSSATGINGDETDNSIFSAGAAYVFTRSGMAWSQQAYLKASNTEDGDEFGRSVAVFGDTVAVGAPAEDSNATGIDGDGTNNSASLAGAAYVFARSNTTWTQQAYLKASNTNPVDEFGSAVAIFGERVVVAAAGEASNATGIDGDQSNNNADTSGAAYVFTRNGTSWAQETYLKASNTESNDQFGFSITISGNTIVAGARLEDSNATGINGDQNNGLSFFSGAAYVFNAETPSADLAVSKTDGQEAVPIGDPITYTLTISNNGPLGVTGALVQDLLQSPLSQGSWECFADPGAKCTATGSGDISDLVDLPSGTSVIYLLTANVEPGFTGTISNTVTVTSPMGVLDPDQNNNSATDQTVTTNLMVDWFSIDGGGGISDGNDIQIIGVIGQADTARMVGGGISVAGGYLPLPVVPSMLADVIFEDGFE